MSCIRRIAIAVALHIPLLAGLPTMASAQLVVCNKTSVRLSMAVAHDVQGEGFVTRGWFTAPPEECITLITGALQNRYYYLHAEAATGESWGDEFALCTEQRAFRIVGAHSCASRGYQRTAFLAIDTQQHTAYTQNLTLGSAHVPMREAINAVDIGWRRSLMDPDTRVMVVSNALEVPVTLALRCYLASGASSKQLEMNVRARGVAELGVLQGWDGNFVDGEWCDVLDRGRAVRRAWVPSEAP
ncbi:DUF1036 domain-containing protein [Gemmatimonas sp.]|jgi:uncharacterized membrane protein|uniref:DUF1036 domain-containing protein n=1 Tax=Gemmatimonas sp. TaxID=1962908 RepID=UPI0037C0987D